MVEPRPYRLDDLAQSTGMSLPSTRTAYDDEIAEVAALLGRQPRTRTTPSPATSAAPAPANAENED